MNNKFLNLSIYSLLKKSYYFFFTIGIFFIYIAYYCYTNIIPIGNDLQQTIDASYTKNNNDTIYISFLNKKHLINFNLNLNFYYSTSHLSSDTNNISFNLYIYSEAKKLYQKMLTGRDIAVDYSNLNYANVRLLNMEEIYKINSILSDKNVYKIAIQPIHNQNNKYEKIKIIINYADPSVTVNKFTILIFLAIAITFILIGFKLKNNIIKSPIKPIPNMKFNYPVFKELFLSNFISALNVNIIFIIFLFFVSKFSFFNNFSKESDYISIVMFLYNLFLGILDLSIKGSILFFVIKFMDFSRLYTYIFSIFYFLILHHITNDNLLELLNHLNYSNNIFIISVIFIYLIYLLFFGERNYQFKKKLLDKNKNFIKLQTQQINIVAE